MVELVQPDITCASSSIISPTISPHFPETSSSKITTPLSAHSPNLPAQTSPNSNGYSTYSHNTNGSSKHVNAAPHRHVLMLLDVQKNMVSDPKTRVHSAEQVRSNIWTVLQAARAADPPPLIVHIRNVGDPGEPDAPDTEGFELYFETLPGEYVINKRKNNAFTSVELDELIPKDAEIVVVGMQSDFCVRATCSAALGRGNVVLLIRGAHATYDRLEVLHGGGYTKARDIENEIEAELEEADVILLDMKDVPELFSDR